ncbi:TPA: hypothetical protein ACISXX_004662, partial [Salmonella enterica subsp. diarizonae serovar 61:l,v:z35]
MWRNIIVSIAIQQSNKITQRNVSIDKNNRKIPEASFDPEWRKYENLSRLNPLQLISYTGIENVVIERINYHFCIKLFNS